MRFNQLPRGSVLRDLLYLSICIGLFYFLWLGSYPLFVPDEGRYTEIAREMIANHDYITPRLNGIAFLDKPILYYWLQALAMHVFGMNEWAFRFFPACIGILGCLITYLAGRQLFNRRTGLIASSLLATTPLYFASAHYANLDLEVAVWISACLLLFIMSMQLPTDAPKRRYLLLLMYACSAFAFLTKGMIGLAFPGMIGLLWLIQTRQLAKLRQLHLLMGISLFLLLVLPWYFLAQVANPEFLHFFFITQQVTRFLSSTPFNNPTPFWFYLPVMLLGMLPWTLVLPFALRFSLRDKLTPVCAYLLIWVGVIFVFFSIPSSKIIGYILPVFPALALLIAHYLDHVLLQKRLRIAFLTCTSATMLALLALVFFAGHLNQQTTKPLVSELKTIIKADDEVIHYYKFYYDVPLYLERPVRLVANWQASDIALHDNWVRELWYGRSFQASDHILIDEKKFWELFHGSRRVFVFLNANYFDQFKRQAQHYYILANLHDILLVSNQPTMLAFQHRFSETPTIY